jgi:type VII secretion integral membrane protein EccD
VTQIDAAAFTRVLVLAPRTRVDVALPADVPLVDLMALLLEMVGERSDDGGTAHDGWHLSPVGGSRLDPARSLRSLDVLDGAALQLAPYGSARPEPVYDDVVDAIAGAVHDRTDGRALRDQAGALVAGAGLLVAAYALLQGERTLTAAATAAVVAVAAVSAAAGLARGGASRTLAVVVGACGAPAAFAAGLLAVPGDVGYPGVLLGSTAAFAYAVLGGLLLGTGTVVFSAITVAAFFVMAGSLSGLLLDAGVGQVAVVVSAFALAAMSMLPWLAVRMSRLPVPVIPTTPDELRDSALGVDFASVSRRAAVAAEYLDGTLTGCAVVVAYGAALALAEGSVFGVLYAVVALAALMLRVRSVPGRLPRTVLLVVGVLGAGAGLGIAVAGLPAGSALGVVAGCAVASAVAVIVTVVAPRRRLSPMTGRSIDIAESLLLAAVLPLAVGAAGLYAAARHL